MITGMMSSLAKLIIQYTGAYCSIFASQQPRRSIWRPQRSACGCCCGRAQKSTATDRCEKLKLLPPRPGLCFVQETNFISLPRGAAQERQPSALHEAARLGRTNMVRALIDAGADVNAADAKLQTPLHEAAREGHLTCVRALLEAGASVDPVSAVRSEGALFHIS